MTCPGHWGLAARKDPLSTHILKGRKPDPPLNHWSGRRGTCISPGRRASRWSPPSTHAYPHSHARRLPPSSPFHLLFPRTDCLSERAAKKPTPVSGLCQRLITLGNLTKLDCRGGAAREGVVKKERPMNLTFDKLTKWGYRHLFPSQLKGPNWISFPLPLPHPTHPLSFSESSSFNFISDALIVLTCF